MDIEIRHQAELTRRFLELENNDIKEKLTILEQELERNNLLMERNNKALEKIIILLEKNYC